MATKDEESGSQFAVIKAGYAPQPRTPAMAHAPIIAQGTATLALVASSLMCTEESKAPSAFHEQI